MMRSLQNICVVFGFLSCWLPFSTLARADVGLIVETPTGMLGFLSDVGHSSVWISRGCLSEQGEVFYCENSPGIVLSSTAYWSNPGAAAIPAELFFLGPGPGRAGHSVAAWNTSLGAAYPDVNSAYGRKYLGRVWRRAMRVTTFATSPEEDRRVLVQIEEQRRQYRYSYSHRNCAFYAQQVLQLYLGPEFHANRVFDWGVYTPRALERSLTKRLEQDPNSSMRVIRFPGTLGQSWRQPPRNFCETALFDPKYAVPLLMFQPYIYVGFGACYGATRLAATAWHKPHALALPDQILPLALVADQRDAKLDQRLVMYERLTGELPTGPGWPAGVAGLVASRSQQAPVRTGPLPCKELTDQDPECGSHEDPHAPPFSADH